MKGTLVEYIDGVLCELRVNKKMADIMRRAREHADLEERGLDIAERWLKANVEADTKLVTSYAIKMFPRLNKKHGSDAERYLVDKLNKKFKVKNSG